MHHVSLRLCALLASVANGGYFWVNKGLQQPLPAKDSSYFGGLRTQHYLCHNPHTMRFAVRFGTAGNFDFVKKAIASMNYPLQIQCVNQRTSTTFEVTSHAIAQLVMTHSFGQAGRSFEPFLLDFEDPHGNVVEDIDTMLSTPFTIEFKDIRKFERRLEKILPAGFGDFARPDPFNPGAVLMNLASVHGFPLYGEKVCARIEIDTATGFATIRHRQNCTNNDDFIKQRSFLDAKFNENENNQLNDFKIRFLSHQKAIRGEWVRAEQKDKKHEIYMPQNSAGNALGGWGVLLIKEKTKHRISFPVLGVQEKGFGSRVMRKFLKEFFNVELMSVSGDEQFPFTDQFDYDGKEEAREQNLIMSFSFLNELSKGTGSYMSHFVQNLKQGSGGTFIEEHVFPHVFVTETRDSLGRVAIGRAVKKNISNWTQQGHQKTYEELKKENMLCEYTKGSDCYFQFIDVHIPFKYGLFAPGGTLHGDSATEGRLLTPIDIVNANANSALIKVEDNPKIPVGFADMNDIRTGSNEKIDNTKEIKNEKKKRKLYIFETFTFSFAKDYL